MNEMLWYVDEFLYFRNVLYVSGWAFHPQYHIIEMGYILPATQAYHTIGGYGYSSPDLHQEYGEAARNCRFIFQLPAETPESVRDLKLVFILENGQRIEIEYLVQRKLNTDPYHKLNSRFFNMLADRKDGSVLEIGSRNRSGVVRRELIPPQMAYTGLDVIAGENVDVVGDVHRMSDLFPSQTFDAIFSMAVFEHLLMPWKVVLEINHILNPDGLVMITTTQSFPLHEMPRDFWRFSDQSWHVLFNQKTGFEILETALGETASVVPHLLHSAITHLETYTGYLGSAVLCRKICETSLTWDVDPQEVIDTAYPE